MSIREDICDETDSGHVPREEKSDVFLRTRDEWRQLDQQTFMAGKRHAVGELVELAKALARQQQQNDQLKMKVQAETATFFQMRAFMAIAEIDEMFPNIVFRVYWNTMFKDRYDFLLVLNSEPFEKELEDEIEVSIDQTLSSKFNKAITDYRAALENNTYVQATYTWVTVDSPTQMNDNKLYADGFRAYANVVVKRQA